MVLGPDRRSVGRQQAGGTQEACQTDQGQIPRRAAEEKGSMMFTPLTDRSRGSVEAALEEARALGHDSLGDEDLLLGILRADEGIAAEALSSCGVTLEGAREESERMTAEALASVGISLEEIRREAGDVFEMRLPNDRKIPFSARAKNALVGAR